MAMDVDLEVIRRAVEGDAAALNEVVAAAQDDIYGLALRMLGAPVDAEDATQEVLVKLVTNLASFRGDSSFRTWAWTIATRHILSFRQGQREAFVSFEVVESMIHDGEGRDVPSPSSPEQELLAKEVRIGCTGAMLLSLNRDQRVAFALVEVFGLSSEESAKIVGVSAATFRKRLQRARTRLGEFMHGNCGLANPKQSCRCPRQIETNVRAGTIAPGALLFATHPAYREPRQEAAARVAETDAIERAVELLRQHPRYRVPERLRASIRNLVNNRSFKIFA